MAISKFFLLCCLLISVQYSVSEDAPSPVPSPEEYAAPPQHHAIPVPAPDSGAPQGAPLGSPLISPPAPSPSDLKSATPSAAPAPTPDSAPAPSPTVGDINRSDVNANEESSGGDGGMSGGKKAGIAVGVIAAACLVGIGGVVYKKRQNNVRRSQYGYAARSDIL